VGETADVRRKRRATLKKQARERARRLQCAACGRGMAYKVCRDRMGVFYTCRYCGHEKGYLWEIAGE